MGPNSDLTNDSDDQCDEIEFRVRQQATIRSKFPIMENNDLERTSTNSVALRVIFRPQTILPSAYSLPWIGFRTNQFG